MDLRLELAVLLIVSDHGRSADDERRAGFIDEDRVHFVHDGEIMTALDLLFLARGHAIIAQVIEAELGVGAVSNIAVILIAPNAWGLIVKNAPDGQTEKLIDRSHPFTIPRREVIIDRHHMNPPASERIEINRQRGDESFSFARGHFGDATRVKGVTADE